MSDNFKLTPDDLRGEAALIGGFIILLGILLYSDWVFLISMFLRPLLIVLGAILILAAAISKKE